MNDVRSGPSYQQYRPSQISALKPLSIQPLKEIKLEMVYKIKHIFLVLVLPTKSVLNIKNHAVYNIHRLVWGSFARETTGHLPIVPIHKTALRTVTVILIIFISTFYSMCISANSILDPSEQNSF
jgi:hypothetical protein